MGDFTLIAIGFLFFPVSFYDRFQRLINKVVRRTAFYYTYCAAVTFLVVRNTIIKLLSFNLISFNDNAKELSAYRYAMFCVITIFF
jgi:hypothetical protein